MFGTLTNLGVRAPDLEAELAFLTALGASGLTYSQRTHAGAQAERVHVHLGSIRLTLFRAGTYDARLEALGSRPTGGIGHAAFGVTSTDAVVEAAARVGVTPLIPTFTVEAVGIGPAAITYFRSPNGMILEAKQALGPKR